MTSAQALTPSSRRTPLRAAVLGSGALGFAAGATAVALAAQRNAEPGDLAMVFLLAVLGAGAALGLWPALLCAAASGLAYNFLFLTPRLTLQIARGSDLFTFGVFFVAALATGWLSGRERDLARRAARRAREVAMLLEAGRRFSGAMDEAAVAAVCVEQIRALTGREGVVLIGGATDADLPADALLAARLSADTRDPAGAGLQTAPDVGWSFRPLGSARPARGVAGVRAPVDASAARLFAGLADLAGTALERAGLASAAVENETLRQTNTLRVALLNSLSHDLRTPLSAVLGAVTTLIDFGPSMGAGVTDDLLETARDGAERLDRYLGELLDLSRLEGGALIPRAEWIDLRDVAAAAARRVLPRLEGRELRREEPDAVAGVRLDPVLMEQALVNLLENALIHAPGPAPVRLRVEVIEGAVRLAVEDEGPGVPRAQQDAVFEPFRRGDDRAGVQGSGLGLSIARGFVEAMGGTLVVESPLEGGRGARFVARFPHSGALRMTGPRPRVLVVDDEPQIHRFLGPALDAAGFEVERADTAAAGLRALALRAPDVVLLDLGLPDFDGAEALVRARAFYAGPIVILSARGRESEKIAALDAGADDYVEKPFGVGELLARLRVLLRRAPAGAGAPQPVIEAGDVSIDVEDRRVVRRGAPVRLSPKEYDLLLALARGAGRVVTHRQLLTAVWGPAHAQDLAYLRVFVGQLRKALEDDPSTPRLIVTEPGVGYRFLSQPP